jgi:hypothetical protein
MDRTSETLSVRDAEDALGRRDLPVRSHIYEANDKHKLPWSRGARGSLCPQVDAQALLGASETSMQAPGKRFATDGRRAYYGQEHAPGRWHGYPVGWKEVPQALWQKWLNEGTVKRSDIHRFWDKTQ